MMRTAKQKYAQESYRKRETHRLSSPRIFASTFQEATLSSSSIKVIRNLVEQAGLLPLRDPF